MLKKALIILSAFFVGLLLLSGITYATTETNMGNDIKNGINNAGTTIVDGAERLGNDIQKGVNDVGSDIVDGARNLGDDVRGGIGNVENGIEGALRMNDTADNRIASNYTATRTVDDGASMGLANTATTTWVWIIMAIAAVVIVALIWYYAATINNGTDRHDDDE